MKQKTISLLLLLIFIVATTTNTRAQDATSIPEENIFVFGGDINLKFVQYVADLTKKKSPRICYLPTASADNPENIKYWEIICKKLDIEPFVLKV